MPRPILLLPALVPLVCALGFPAGAQKGSAAPPPVSSPATMAYFGVHPAAGEAPLTVRFVDRSFGGVTSWSWDFGDGGTSRLADPTHVYTEGGVYPVALTVTGPLGTDTLVKPQGVVVRSCTLENARENRGSPLERGEDFVPITGDDALGFYCVYSGKAVGPDNPGIANNVGIFVLPLTGGEVLVFGAGYGDANSQVVPTEDAAFDARRVDAIIRFCIGREPAATPLRLVAPHGHIDHVNADFVRELRARGYPIVDIAYHANDAPLVKNLPGWTPADRAIFRPLRSSSSQCQTELLAFDSPLGKLWFFLRPGHTDGSIDLVIDVRGDPTNRFIVRGSGSGFGSCPIPNTREAIEPHGNVILTAPEPRLFAVSPATGSALGGTPVALSGDHFAASLAGLPLVLFDGAAADAVRVLDDATLTCTAPAGLPGQVARIQVVNRNGQAALDGAFSFRPFPTLTSVSPAHGLASGGTRVTLRGSGFVADAPGTTAVTFGGLAASAVQAVDDATLECTTPAGGAGAVDVALANGNGAARLDAGYFFDPVIDVESVSPATGSSLGGTRVTILGSAFAGGAAVPEVFFGGGRATDVVRASDTRLLCTTPPGPAGTQVDVRVSGDNGSDTLVKGFRYFVAPRVSAVDPASGPAAGGTPLTITGANFTRNGAGANTVTLGGAPATSVVTLSDTTLQCRAPAGTAGTTVEVQVSNANGTGRLEAGYRYHRPPALASVEPAQGSRAGGTPVTLRGSGFLETGAGPTTVLFGGSPAAAVSVLDDLTLTCLTPAAASDAPVDVELANANGRAQLAQAFRYSTQPVLSGVSPAQGPASGDTRVTLTGGGFLASGAGAPAVAFGGVPATAVLVLGDATLTCLTPLGAPGTSVDVSLVNGNGRARLPGAFRYQELPGLTEVRPSEGPVAGGTRVVVQGSGFLAGTPRVSFGGSLASGMVVRDDRHLECTTPPAAQRGAVDVRLTCELGTAVLHDGYVYGSTRPTISGLEPDHGPGAGGNTVLVHGANFTASQAGTNVVTFGGLPASSVVARDDGLLSCLAPAGAPGSRVDVRVRNDNGSAVLAAGYRYHLQPTLAAVVPARGSPLGGQTVTLTGSGFLADGAGEPGVRIGGASASEVLVLDDGSLTCRVPGGAPGTDVDVELVNSNGSARLAAGFRYVASPTLVAVAPAAGTPLGGTAVTLSGGGFAPDLPDSPRVAFGSALATAVAVVDDATLTCLAPAGAAGASVDVSFANDNGTALLALAYRYHPGPVISALSRDSGPAAGGTTVVLTGSGFLADVVGPNTVTFGGLPARSVTTVDDTRVRAVTPAGTPGARVDVILANSNGSATVAQGFRYHALPTVTALSPSGASALGGATVTLTGTGFQRDNAGTNTVRFGASSASAVTVVDDQTLRCLAPGGTSGEQVSVSLANNNGTAVAAEPFRYFAAPRVDELQPPHGFSGGGTLVEVHGAGFLLDEAGANAVLLGGLTAAEVTVLDDRTLRCRTPAGTAGPVAVQVSNDNGSSTLPDGFYYDWAPTLTGIQPAAGSSLGGTEVRLTGGGFATEGAGTLAVRFGAASATNVRILDGQSLLCTAPAGTAGVLVSVAVSNSRGTSSLDGFRYHPPPTLTAVDPSQGPPAGGTRVTLRGTGFVANDAGVPAVRFGTTAATGITVIDDTTVRCTAPAGPARTSVAVALANANGSASFPDGYRWVERLTSDLTDDGLGDALLAAAEAVYLFFGAASLPVGESTATADLVFRSSAAGTDFGAQVAFGDLNADQYPDAVVCAPLDDSAGIDAGAVFAFFGPFVASPTPRTSAGASAVFRGAAAGDRFGTSVLVWDVTGDGLADLLTGAPQNDAGGMDAGAVYVYRGGASFTSQPTSSAAVRLLGSGNQGAFGSALAGGDLTGDGKGDVAVGASLLGASGGSSGSAYVFRGGATLSSTSAASAQVQIAGASSGDRLGTSAACGDFDGDGVDDLFLGAPEARENGNLSGSIFVFRGGATLVSGPASDALVRLDGEASGDRLGQVLCVGDADGDGLVDLLCGAPQHDVPASNSGRAYLLGGGTLASGTVSVRADTVLTAESSAGDLFGSGLSITDLDGDGLGDLIVGAPFSNGGGSDSGRAYVFLGAALQATRSAAADDTTFTGAQAAMTLGREVGSSR